MAGDNAGLRSHHNHDSILMTSGPGKTLTTGKSKRDMVAGIDDIVETAPSRTG